MFKGSVFAKGDRLVKLAAWGRLLLLALFFTTGVGSVNLRADGKVFSQVALADPQIPDQRALIHYENGIETLIIDTAFKGQGTNFAWVVPLPSVPKISEVSTGLFPTLQLLFKPELRHFVPKWFLGVFIFGFLTFTVLRAVQKRSVWGLVVIWFGFFVLVLTSVPFVVPRGGSNPVAGLEVLQTEHVGIYDTVTLAATNGATLLSWLGTNGFAVPPNSLPVIQDYAHEGWVFVASKLHLKTNPGEPLSAHPLAFTFLTDRAVYPLRLTGIDNKTCKIELFVFGTSQAAAAHFTTEQSEQPEYPPVEENARNLPIGFAIGHPGLTNWVKQAPFATKLTAKLGSEEMKQDAYVEWLPYQRERQVRYSASGALITATNYASFPVVILLLAVYWISSGKGGLRAVRQRTVGIITATILACWALAYLALPKVAVAVTQSYRYQQVDTFQQLEQALIRQIENREKASINHLSPALASEAAWLREQLREGSATRQKLDSRWQTNTFTNLPWHEEDSPGNYMVHQESNDVIAVWYDSHGHENEFFRMSEALAR